MLAVGFVFGFEFSFGTFDRATFVLGNEADLSERTVKMPDVLELHIEVVGSHAWVIWAATRQSLDECLPVGEVSQDIQLPFRFVEKSEEVVAIP